MQITLTNTGKRYNRDWIFRRLGYHFLFGEHYAITGPNGSGKSTLLQVIAGAIMQTEGKVEYSNTSGIRPEQAYKQLSFAAPYLELIEEMTASEFLLFHSTFKPLIKTAEQVLNEVSLKNASHKQIRYFSSGMKQRLKLAQAFFSETTVLLLDEPTTNLDEDGIALYHHLVNNYSAGKTIIVSSNDKQEYSFCKEVISILDYK